MRMHTPIASTDSAYLLGLLYQLVRTPLQGYNACLPFLVLQWWGNLEYHHKKNTMCINIGILFYLSVAQLWS